MQRQVLQRQPCATARLLRMTPAVAGLGEEHIFRANVPDSLQSHVQRLGYTPCFAVEPAPPEGSPLAQALAEVNSKLG